MAKAKSFSMHLEAAKQHYGNGRLNEAAADFEEALQSQPRNSEIIYMLGIIRYQQGRPQDSIATLRKAFAIQPSEKYAHGLGAILLDLRRNHEAIRAFRAALVINPASLDVHQLLGCALQQTLSPGEAIALLQRAIRLGVQAPITLYILGCALADCGRFDEALETFQSALRVQPDYAEVQIAISGTYRRQGRFDEATAILLEGTKRKPDHAETYNELGVLLFRQEQQDRAVAAFRQAIQLAPEFAPAYSNFGVALKDMGRMNQSIAMFRHAIDLQPDFPEALYQYVFTLMKHCAWSDLADRHAQLLDFVRRGRPDVAPWAMCMQPSTPADQLACARLWSRKLQARISALPPRQPDSANRRIRIGYLSSDFRMHAVSFLIAGLIEHHDRSHFEVIGYSLGADDGSELRRRVAAAFDRFVDVRSLPDRQVADAIRQDGIDILIDLNGYTAGARTEILAFRPAPIQVNYLGFPATMGADFIDYMMTDRFCTAPEHQQHYSEHLVYLPSYQPNDSKRAISPRVPTRATFGLPDRSFVFASFNNSYKITPEFFDVWMRLLGAVPGSVFWLKDAGDEANGNLRREAAARGIDPDRLIFARPLASHELHLARHGCADLFLDTLPYNAHTTASDALWAGAPMITCVGDTFAGRVAGSVLSALGVPELITHSLQEYEALALRLANDPPELAALRVRLRQARSVSPLFDTARYTRTLESAYARMWALWRAGRPPEAITVESDPIDAVPTEGGSHHAAPAQGGTTHRTEDGRPNLARVIVPMLLNLLSPAGAASAVDVGGGAAEWLAVLREFGVRDTRALTAPIPAALAPAMIDGPAVDLALALDVAGGVAPHHAGGFIDALARLAPAVLFSAQIPYEAGDAQTNGQWPSYWYEHFRRNGFRPVDVLRDSLWGRPDVDPRWAQNLILYVREQALPSYPQLTGTPLPVSPRNLDRVHPACFEAVTRRLAAQSDRPLPPEPPRAAPPADLRQERRTLARDILALDATTLPHLPQRLGQVSAMLETGLPDEPLDAAAEGELAAIDATGGGILQFVAKTLYRRPYQLGVLPDLTGMAPPLAVDLLRTLVAPPALYQAPEDSDRFANFLYAVAGQVRDLAGTDPAHPVARAFVQHADTLPAALGTVNIRPLLALRAHILEAVLREDGAPLDWTPPPRDGSRARIRLGVLVRSFASGADLALALPLFRDIDRTRFEVLLFAAEPSDGPAHQACAELAGEALVLPETEAAAVALIRSRDLDVLILGADATAHGTRTPALAAHRLARVQVAGAASPTTTGLSHMDVHLSGTLAEAADGGNSHYTEHLIQLDGAGFCFGPDLIPSPVHPPVTRREFDIPEDALVFASGAPTREITPEVREAWAEILAAVPGSLLVLFPFGAAQPNSPADRLFIQAFQRTLHARGVPEDRVRYFHAMPNRQAVKALLSLCDVGLTPFTCLGAMPVLDALETGLPTVARAGFTMRNRRGAAMLLDLGVPDLVAESNPGYVALARRLGTDAGFRTAMAEAVRTRMAAGPRFLNTADYARLLESALAALVRPFTAT